MQIPIGWCADRFNLKWLYAAMFLLWSLAQGISGFATSLAMLMTLRVILGIGESIYLPGGTKIVTLLFRPSERGLPSGLFDFGTRTDLVGAGGTGNTSVFNIDRGSLIGLPGGILTVQQMVLTGAKIDLRDPNNQTGPAGILAINGNVANTTDQRNRQIEIAVSPFQTTIDGNLSLLNNTRVVYTSDGPNLYDGVINANIMGNHVDLFFGTPQQLVPQIAAGKLKAFGFTSSEKSAQLPNADSFPKMFGPKLEAMGYRLDRQMFMNR